MNPKGTIRIVEQSDHNPQYEEADNFDFELLTWLKQTPKSFL